MAVGLDCNLNGCLERTTLDSGSTNFVEGWNAGERRISRRRAERPGFRCAASGLRWAL